MASRKYFRIRLPEAGEIVYSLAVPAAVVAFVAFSGCGRSAAPVDEHTKYVCVIAYNAYHAGVIDNIDTANAIVVNGRESPVPAVYSATQAYAEELPTGVAPRARASTERYRKLIKVCENAGWSA